MFYFQGYVLEMGLLLANVKLRWLCKDGNSEKLRKK